MDWQVINAARSGKYLTLVAVLMTLAAVAAGAGLARGDGKPDRSYGVKGVASVDADPLSIDSPSDAARDDQGRIVLGGTTYNGPGGNQAWFARLNRDGSIDPTFGTAGVALFSLPGSQFVSTVTIDPEGRIVAAGNWDMPMNRDMWVLRLNEDGTPDLGFGIGGGSNYDSGQDFDLGFGVAVAGDGLIYLAGSTGDGTNDRATIVRYTPDGNPDPTWGVGGAVQLDVGGISARAEAIRLDRRGRVVLGGYRQNADESSDFLAIRLTRKGALDKSFNGRGYRTIRFVRGQRADVIDIAVDRRGRTLLAGGADFAPDGVSDGLLARLKPNGNLDRRFGKGGKVARSIFGTRVELSRVRIDRAGRIVLAGSAQRANGTQKALLLRLLSNGRPDRSFAKKGQLQTSFGEPEASGTTLVIDGKGRYLLGGRVFETGLAYVSRHFAKYPRRK